MMEPPTTGDWVEVGTKSQFSRRKKGWSLVVDGRHVALFCTNQGELHCTDLRCYHAGGPLHEGVQMDIEELGGRPCVACPFHGYRFMLDNGESLYEQILQRGEPGQLKSKGVKQRVHSVKVEDDRVFIKLELGGDPCASDFYSSEEYKNRIASARRLTTAAPPAATAPAQEDNKTE